MVSIIPGIECFAPERTETSKGSAASPNRRPLTSSSRAIAAFASSRTASGSVPSRR